MSNRALILVGLAVVGSWTAPAHAQSAEAIVGIALLGDGPVLVLPVLLRFADLTTAQTTQVRRILETGSLDAQGVLGQLAAANNQLDEALLAPAATPRHDASALIQRMAHLRLQLMQRELKTVMAVRKVLTPQQLSKVTAALDEMMKRGEIATREPRETF